MEWVNQTQSKHLRGLAMLVPLKILVSVGDVLQDDLINDPGAYISTHEPKLLNSDWASVLVVEPTVIASGSEAGDELQASVLSFPAATTMTTPAFTAAATA